MKRVALIIQYDGSYYSGWQRQKNAISVQETIENCLFKISNQIIKTFASGRTDAGVHASGQVVHFDIDFVKILKVDESNRESMNIVENLFGSMQKGSRSPRNASNISKYGLNK